VGDKDPAIDSVVELWPGANWLERETYDLMGIRFNNHPDLRRVLLPDDWQGYPLRKEYPLKGKEEWAGMTELLTKIKELDRHGFDPEGHVHGQSGPEKEDV
jgi:NADH-quinone oxidoreductase subunit C